MASGNSLILFSAQAGAAPGSEFATIEELVGGSSPPETIPLVDFRSDIRDYMDYYGVMPEHYDGGGVSVSIMFSAGAVAPDVVQWDAAFRRVANDAENLTASHAYQYNSVIIAVPTVEGEVVYAPITFTNGADMDNVVAGDYFILRIARDITPASGTNAPANCSPHKIYLVES